MNIVAKFLLWLKTPMQSDVKKCHVGSGFMGLQPKNIKNIKIIDMEDGNIFEIDYPMDYVGIDIDRDNDTVSLIIKRSDEDLNDSSY